MLFWRSNIYVTSIRLDQRKDAASAFQRPSRAGRLSKILQQVADELFEVKYESYMHHLGVMATAEQGIVEFLNAIGQMPVDDFDFVTGEIKKQ